MADAAEIPCSVFIDGSNFYKKLTSLGFLKLLEFDYAGFASFLAQGHPLIERRYYIGAVRNDDKSPKSEKLHCNQQKLLENLTKHGFSYTLGYLLKGTDGVYHEKGVDVQIAIDVVKAAYEATCKRIYLVTSDTDLIPAIQLAKNKGVEVIYVGFKHQVSYALKANASRYKRLQRDDIAPFANTTS